MRNKTYQQNNLPGENCYHERIIFETNICYNYFKLMEQQPLRMKFTNRDEQTMIKQTSQHELTRKQENKSLTIGERIKCLKGHIYSSEIEINIEETNKKHIYTEITYLRKVLIKLLQKKSNKKFSINIQKMTIFDQFQNMIKNGF